MTVHPTTPIQILGAGLTGMSAGHHLGEGYTLHERLPHVGGHVITLEREGYRFDRTGHLLHLRNPEIRAWVERLLPGRMVRVHRNSRVWSEGVYTRYPYQANTFGLPAQVAYECITGYLAALEKKREAPAPRDFEQFCLLNFGEGFSKHFMIPYNQKLWGAHPSEITAAWCARFVPLPKLEDVIAGAVGMNDRELGYNAEFLYPRTGIGELTSALGATLTSSTRHSHAPQSIDWKRRRLLFADGEVPYEALISTAPLDALLKLMPDLPAEVSFAATRLRCNPLYYLDVALEKPCGVDLHWAYVPEQRYPFYRVGCYSNFSSELAPAGKANLYVELSSRQPPELAKLLPEVAAGLQEMGLIARPEDVRFAELRRIEHAYVIFDHHYYESLEAIRPFLLEQRIVSAGRYGGWNYSSMEDALLFGRDAARQAQELRT